MISACHVPCKPAPDALLRALQAAAGLEPDKAGLRACLAAIRAVRDLLARPGLFAASAGQDAAGEAGLVSQGPQGE